MKEMKHYYVNNFINFIEMKIKQVNIKDNEKDYMKNDVVIWGIFFQLVVKKVCWKNIGVYIRIVDVI